MNFCHSYPRFLFSVFVLTVDILLCYVFSFSLLCGFGLSVLANSLVRKTSLMTPLCVEEIVSTSYCILEHVCIVSLSYCVFVPSPPHYSTA